MVATLLARATAGAEGVRAILVLTAVDLEARGLARRLGLERVGSSPWPHYRGDGMELAAVGVAASCLLERAPRLDAPALVIAAGTCGALAPELAVGDLVVPKIVLAPDGARVTTDPLPALEAEGMLATVDTVAETAEVKARLHATTGALAVDMESATILGWARQHGARGAAIRGVSDTAVETVPADLAALVAPDGRVRAARAVGVMIARPWAVRDALALRRGTEAALDAVARALDRLAAAQARG